MRTINIKKAQPSPDKIQSVTLIIDETIRTSTTIHAADELYTYDAVELENALHAALPGGTYDRLVQMMLERKASHLAVSRAS